MGKRHDQAAPERDRSLPGRSQCLGAIGLVIATCLASMLGPTGGGRAGASAAAAAVPGTVPAGCGRPTGHPGWATCDELFAADAAGHPMTDATKPGYSPAQLRAAYGLSSASTENGAGQTVAVVEAYNDPDAEADLAVYRTKYHLPACASGCFSVVNQTGAAQPLPSDNDQGWASEQSLDLDMVSAICPLCKLLVVEAKVQSAPDLLTGIRTAVRLGANVVSNSFGTSETAADLGYDQRYLETPGAALVAASGDDGYGVEFPAAAPSVTAVGGTELKKSSSAARGWTELAWAGGGSGCSTEEPKPSWQTDQGCAQRTVADVSADADPATGVASYDSDCSPASAQAGLCIPGWSSAGGTSVGTPIVAGIYALAGNAGTVDGASSLYANPSGLNDITGGANGTCSPAYLCTAGPGYDGPTGIGSPDGIGAF